jgi:enoyl-CoA hydratase
LKRVADDPLDEGNYEAIATIYHAFARVAALKVPSISAVRGAVVGGGLNLMLATDLRIVATTARIRSGFLGLGFHPGGGHYALLGRALQRDAVAAIGIFDEEITGARAAEIGLAWEAHPEGGVEPRAFELARKVARLPTVTRMAVASMRAELGPPPLPLPSSIDVERAAQLYSIRNRHGESKP